MVNQKEQNKKKLKNQNKFSMLCSHQILTFLLQIFKRNQHKNSLQRSHFNQEEIDQYY